MGDSSKEKRLYNIENSKCILVEFLNETDGDDNNLVQTGYLCWLDEKDASDIHNIISNSIPTTINWPMKIDVSSAQQMKTKLKNAKFEKHTAKILAYGEWTDIRRKQNTLEKYGVLSTKKEDRNKLKRKMLEDNDDENLCDSQSGKARKNIQSSFASDENLFNSIAFVGCENEVSYKDSSDSESDANEDQDSEMVKLLQNKDEAIEKLENDKVALQEKINKQEEDFKELLDDKLAIESKYKKLKEDHSKVVNNFKYESLISETVHDLSTIKNIIDNRLNYFKTMKAKCPISDITNTQPSFSSNIHMDPPEDPLAEDTDNNAEKLLETDATKQNNQNTQPKATSKKPKYKKGKEPTDFVITNEHLANVDKSSVQQFTRDILEALFDDQELRTCSLTGQKSNAFKHLQARPALDKNKIAAARNYCHKLFYAKQPNCIGLFNYAAGQKLNDMKKFA